MPTLEKHPGAILKELLVSTDTSQRELSSVIQIAHSNLHSILSEERSISADIAVRLEAAGLKKASFWLEKQMKFDLAVIKKKSSQDTDKIKYWKIIQENVPVNYLKQQGIIGSDRDQDIKAVLKLYNSKDTISFEKAIDSYQFSHFRKSSAFKETRNNVIAWSLVAEHTALNISTSRTFDPAKKDELIAKLKVLFLENSKILDRTKKLLLSYGIKFFTLDRPSKTPVDGKSFMSGSNPAIVLSLKYKRLDNFAFTLMHELGHVYKHLIKPSLKGESFFTNNTSNDQLEFEADSFARNELIPLGDWNKFVESTHIFTDDSILRFAKRVKMHPAIVRGRVCYEFNNYYRRASKITDTNKIDF